MAHKHNLRCVACNQFLRKGAVDPHCVWCQTGQMRTRRKGPLQTCSHPGCGKALSKRHLKTCAAHVPRSVRANAARKSRRTFAYRKRMATFTAEIAQLMGERVTREDLLEVFRRVYVRGYGSGWQACRKGYRSYCEDVA